MMTSADERAHGVARARNLLATIEEALAGTGFTVTATKTLTDDMVPSLEQLAKLANRYSESLQAHGDDHDAASLLDEVGLILERPPLLHHVAALDAWKALLGPESHDAQLVDGQDASATVPRSIKVTLERARESLAGLQDDVETLTAEVTRSIKRIDARLNVMLTGPRPDLWASTTEGFELQVLLLLELRFAETLGFDPDNGALLQERYSAFLRPRFPNKGCRPLSAVTNDFTVVRQALSAFRETLLQRHLHPGALNEIASATG